MKVQLIVVQGKPEGKVIPLTMPILKIGRGEDCHLRPNSELVSREHAEFAVTPDKVTVRDLGSRNGTLVNGKALTGAYTLKDRDLVQVGPLTFAVSIQGAPVPASPSAKAAKPGASPDDISHDEIGAWLVADETHPTPDRPSGVYGGETQTFTNYKAGERPAPAEAKPAEAKPADAPPKAPPPPAAKPAAAAKPFSFDDEIERLPEGEGDVEEMTTGTLEEDGAAEEPEEEPIEELIDESNPFSVAKKKAEEPAKPAASQDSSDAASEILRKMMERRRGPR